MRSRRIGVRLKCRAERIEADGVALAGGEFIEGATVICTTGTRPNPLVERLDVAQQRGRIVTAPDLSVVGNPGVWAIGDCARVRNSLTQQWAPPTAQFAVAQAKTLARNIQAWNGGRPTRPFRHRSKG